MVIEQLNTLTNEILQCCKCKRAVEGRSFALSHYYAYDLSKVKFMFIGQNPGPPTKLEKTFKITSIDEFKQIYFYGLKNSNLGKFLDFIFSKITDLNWENLFLTNIVKCHIIANKTPSKIEVNNCLPFLEQQLKLVKPKIIICMGKLAFANFLQQSELMIKMTLLHGKVFKKEDCFILPILHYVYMDQQANAYYLRESFITTFKSVLKEVYGK
ncbi:hypothetical protein KKF45_05670 [Patescibacteria group bacterium]|nr:hypothetical protein [Patescibacteria group bacterium]